MEKTDKIGTVDGLGDIYLRCLPLDRQIRAFQELGINYPYLVDTRDVVRIRLAGVSNNGTRTSVAPVSAKGERTILIRPSPLMNLAMASYAIDAHRNNSYPTMPREFYEVAKRIAKNEESLEPEDRTAIILSQDGDFKLTHEMPEARFSLGQAGEYFNKVNHKKIDLYNLPAPDNKDLSYVNYLWFKSPQDDSDLNCGGRYLDDDSNAFGVLNKSAEGTSKKSSDHIYSLTDIRKAHLEVVPRVLAQQGVPVLESMLKKPLN